MDYKYFKWHKDSDIYCAVVKGVNLNIADYYKNGELYARLQGWINQPTDIEISEKEFENLLKRKL